MIDYLAPKKVLTPAEYFSKFVNFYGESLGAASGVQTTVDSPTDTTTPGEVPSIYDDQGGEGSDRAEEGRLQAETMLKDPSRGLQFFDKAEDVYDTRANFDFSEAFGFGGDMVKADDFFGSMVDTPYGTKQRSNGIRFRTFDGCSCATWCASCPKYARGGNYCWKSKSIRIHWWCSDGNK
jgi:hypothetical protein